MSSIIPFEYEPMRQNRYLVEFPEQFEIKPWLVNNIEKPKLDIHKTLNGIINIWQPIKIDFIDVIGENLSKKLLKMTVNEEIDFTIKMLDPTGVVVETWLIKSSLLSIDFGLLNYGSDDITKIMLTVTPSLVIIE